MTIFKYLLMVQDTQVINLPRGAEILTAQYQGSSLCIWAKLDESEPLEPRRIRVAGTGHVIPVEGHYIATVQQFNGNLIWHIFEEGI